MVVSISSAKEPAIWRSCAMVGRPPLRCTVGCAAGCMCLICASKWATNKKSINNSTTEIKMKMTMRFILACGGVRVTATADTFTKHERSLANRSFPK